MCRGGVGLLVVVVIGDGFEGRLGGVGVDGEGISDAQRCVSSRQARHGGGGHRRRGIGCVGRGRVECPGSGRCVQSRVEPVEVVCSGAAVQCCSVAVSETRSGQTCKRVEFGLGCLEAACEGARAMPPAK